MTSTVSTIPAIWVLIMIGLGSLLLFGILLRPLRYPVETTLPHVSLVSALVTSWLAPTVVMLVFMGLSGSVTQQLENAFQSPPTSPPLVFDRDHPAEVSSTATGENQESPSDIKHPDWLVERDSTDGDVRQVVLVSKLWSTEHEARQDLVPRAAAIVRNDFQNLHQQHSFQPGPGLMTDEQLLEAACKKQYLERVDQDFGSFKSPMCRLWMQIELSPIVRTSIYPAWKSALVGNRTLLIGTYLAFLTLAANTVVLFTRLRSHPRGNWVAAAVISLGSMLAWGTVGVYWLRQLIR